MQALRALAIGLVLFFHVFPDSWLPGGFVGVDVFFVVSGYLITDHLVREATATDRVRLGAFYARRVRRLLPAALVTLLAGAALAAAFLPWQRWPDDAVQIRAAALYVENLYLATQSVTYAAAGQDPSLVQHFWSLSTEEQFYLVWPVLILAAFAVARRLGRHLRWVRRPGLACSAVALVGLGIASLWCSVALTATEPAQAYFLTTTRAWEFGAGGLVVFLLRIWCPPPALGAHLRRLGIAAVVASAALIHQSDGFPGAVALWPVFGTALVIVAGAPIPGGFAHRVVTAGGVQRIGRISYSIYLWHWPLLIVFPYAVHVAELGVPHRLALILLVLGVSDLSQRFVEDGTRYVPALRSSTRATLVAAAAGMAVVILAAAVLGTAGARRADTADASAADRVGGAGTVGTVGAGALGRDPVGNPCVGAAAAVARTRCPDWHTTPATVQISNVLDEPWQTQPGCVGRRTPGYMTCVFGSGATKVAVVGDSHMEQWMPAIALIGARRGWTVYLFVSPGCPPTFATLTGWTAPVTSGTQCRDIARWTRDSVARLGVQHILMSSRTLANRYVDDAEGIRGQVEAFASFAELAPVTAILDTADPGRNIPGCLARTSPENCTTPRTTAVRQDVWARAAVAAKVDVVDPNDAICDADTCYPVVGGLPVYFDDHHLAARFVATTAPFLADRLTALPSH